MGSDREESRGVSRIFTRRTRNLASVRNIALVRKSYLSFLLLFFFFLTLSFPYTVKSSLFNLCSCNHIRSSIWFFSSSFFSFCKEKRYREKARKNRKKGKMAVDARQLSHPFTTENRGIRPLLSFELIRKIVAMLSKLIRCTLRKKWKFERRRVPSSFLDERKEKEKKNNNKKRWIAKLLPPLLCYRLESVVEVHPAR